MNRGRIALGLALAALVVGCASKPKSPPTYTETATHAESATAPTSSALTQKALTTYPTTAGVGTKLALSADADGRIVERPWPQAIARYPNGSTPAGATYFPNADEPTDRPDWQAAFIDLGMFALDTIILPVNMILTPPWKTVVYHGAEQTQPVPGTEK
jgi:hypothetical protein